MTSKRPSILFLIPYFGRWPFWMPLFLESCRRNPDIDWLLISDCPAPVGLPANVTIKAMDFLSYCSLAAERLGIPFAPEDPYKLCDIKPALGHIHEEVLQGYDFWAFGDLDVVYGDLRSWLSDARLARYDVITSHSRRVAGHLCLLRNTETYRTLYRRMTNWQRRFCDRDHHALDEGAFTRLFLWRKNFPKPLFELVGLFNPLRRKSLFEETFSTPNGCIPWCDGSFDFPQRWYWRDGVVSSDAAFERQYPYFHFACWKRGAWRMLEMQDVQAIAASRSWIIDAQGIHSGDL